MVMETMNKLISTKRSRMLSIAIISLIIKFLVSNAGQVCHNAYECALTLISDNTTDNSNIECYGYHSCSNCNLIESSATANIQCHGSFSCYNSSVIQITGTVYSQQINCMFMYDITSNYILLCRFVAEFFMCIFLTINIKL